MPARLRPHAAPAALVWLAVVLALAVVAVLALSGAEAAGQGQPKCGDTITKDTTLHEDLVNCPNNGIRIGVDNVTLDLNGHTIDGDGTPAAGCNPRKQFCDTGVVNFGHDGVTVMHGSMRQLEAGVNFGEVRHNRLLGISASRNHVVGIQLFSDSRSLVRDSSGNGSIVREGGSGIVLFDSDHVRVVNNSFSHNGDQGIFIGESPHNLIKGNLLSRNDRAGITLQKSNRNQVRRNRSVRDGGLGIYVAPGSRNVIAGNRVSHALGGIEIDGGDHNVFAHNSVRDTERNAITVGFDVVVGNVVRGNRIRGAGGDGVFIYHKAKHTLVRGNRASHAKDDGIDVAGRTTKLTENHAVRNGDLGIEAVRGVINGGGNVARHNGDPRQCTNIACS